MRGFRNFVRGGPILTTFILFFFFFFFFLIFEWRGDTAGHHRPAGEPAFRWRADDGPTLKSGIFRGIRTCIARNLFWSFSRAPPPLSRPPVPPFRSTHARNDSSIYKQCAPQSRPADRMLVLSLFMQIR